MKLTPEHLRLLANNPPELAISGEAALEFVQRERRNGGCLPTLAVGTLIGFMFSCVIVALSSSPVFLVYAAVAAVPVCYLLKRGYRTNEEAQAIRDAAALPPPLSAVLSDHTLLLGTTGAHPQDWCQVPVTVPEQQQIRMLGLPTARVRKP